MTTTRLSTAVVLLTIILQYTHGQGKPTALLIVNSLSSKFFVLELITERLTLLRGYEQSHTV